ncbi:MAG: hypothetical protein AB7G28_09580 [Pirellulales bacterium]
MKSTLARALVFACFSVNGLAAGEPVAQRVATSPSNAAVTNARLGIGFAFLYGYQGVPAVPFMPAVHELGGGNAKIYVFWNQLEPEQGKYDWSATDAFVDQLHSPEEGLIAVFSSSTWATKLQSTMIPASPAKNLDEYYRFIHDLVSRYKGRVRYWQNDCEPNNPVYWSGTKEEFVDELKVFYKAVKDADPNAVIVAGGYDGLFNPPGLPPMYNQEAGLAFFDYVLDAGRDAFDVFDLRLYADPYTIPGRVEAIRGKMQALGYSKPIFATEYGGPGFFEFAANRQYIPLIAAWSQAAAAGDAASAAHGKSINDLYEQMDQLAPETQMFLAGCSPELEAKMLRLEAREIAIRNVLALSAGVERTAYWQLIQLTLPRDNIMQLMYGKIGLYSFEGGVPTRREPIAGAFQRTARALKGVRQAKRIELPDHPDVYAFQLDRGTESPGLAIWLRRDTFTGEDQPPVEVSLPWSHGPVAAVDVLGNKINTKVKDEKLLLPVSVTPIFVAPTRGH